MSGPKESGRKPGRTSDSGDDTWAEQNTSRGGDKDGCCPDYEKAQSPMNDQRDFDHEDTKW